MSLLTAYLDTCIVSGLAKEDLVSDELAALRQETSAHDVEKKKAEPRTPHFLSSNQDIVAWSQEEKWGLKYSQSRVIPWTSDFTPR